MNDTNIVRDEYVDLDDPYRKANQTQLDAPAASIGRNVGRLISNKSEKSHGNTTSGTYTVGIDSTHASQDTVPRLLSKHDCGTEVKGLSYSFVDITINKDNAEFTYDKAKAVPNNFDESSNPWALKDNVYDRHKRSKEVYDVTYHTDHVAIRSNNYDHAQTLGGTGRK
ncbi:hypothetical protein CHS0354_002402 [Potamilus streckersoni]|nr:hypothetical protein CHS0354_002402 [Potamilus streckersoni]